MLFRSIEISSFLPAGFTNTGNLALVGEFAEANAADSVLAENGMGPAAETATGVSPGGILGSSLLLVF